MPGNIPRGWKVSVEPSGSYWRCRWRGKYGTGQRTFFKEADANELRDSMVQDFKRRDAGLPALERPEVVAARKSYATFRSEHLKYLEHYRSKSTHYNTKRSMDLWEEFAGQLYPVTQKQQKELGGKTVQDWTFWLLEHQNIRNPKGGYHPNNVRLRLRHFKAAMRQAYFAGFIDYDPFFGFVMPPEVEVARLLKPQEMRRIMEALPESSRRAVLFVSQTGLRIGEVCGAAWEGVEKRGKNWYLTVWKSKTRRGRPETKTIALTPEALAAAGPRRKSGRIFEVSVSTLEHNMEDATERIGIGRIRWHDLRHSAATYLMQELRDLKSLQLWGGWATAQAAMRYQHATEKRSDAGLKMRLPGPTGPLLRTLGKGGTSKKRRKFQ